MFFPLYSTPCSRAQVQVCSFKVSYIDGFINFTSYRNLWRNMNWRPKNLTVLCQLHKLQSRGRTVTSVRTIQVC